MERGTIIFCGAGSGHSCFNIHQGFVKMCSTHEENCRECGIRLAWWSMYDNIQYADEYNCRGAINEETTELLSKNYKLLTDEQFNTLSRNNGKKLVVCNIRNNTTFCKKCAKKLDYKCPVCGGDITLSRKA